MFIHSSKPSIIKINIIAFLARSFCVCYSEDMNVIISFLGELFRKSILAFFITMSVTTALFFPFLMLIMIGVAAGSEDKAVDGMTTKYVYGKELSKNKILTIPITGVIYGDMDTDGGGSGFFEDTSNTYGYDVKRLLRQAAKDSSIKAVVLEINSPGGTIYGSQAIADAISAYKESTKKPVYAHVTGMAASGAYWAAVGADKIVADLGSIVGSIGVINGGFMVYNNPIALDGGLLGGGVTTKDGIESYYITSGKGKDLGNPYRKPTEEELQVLQTGAENNYKLFVKRVSDRRGIDEEVIRNTIGAYIYDNESAIERKLLDMTGSREFSYAQLAKEANLGTDYQVVSGKERRSKLEALLEAVSKQTIFRAQSEDLGSRLKAEFCAPHKPLVYYGDVAKVCAN